MEWQIDQAIVYSTDDFGGVRAIIIGYVGDDDGVRWAVMSGDALIGGGRASGFAAAKAMAERVLERTVGSI